MATQIRIKWVSKASLLFLVALLLACSTYSLDNQDWQQSNNAIKLEHWQQCVNLGWKTDILFVLDNSPSMAAKQLILLDNIESWLHIIENSGFSPKFHAAVITTGMISDGCPSCSESITSSCINASGETGRFQAQLGKITWHENIPVFSFQSDPSCRVVDKENLDCLYNRQLAQGTLLVGTQGCEYSRGLAAMRRALQPDMLGSENIGFLRKDAELIIIFVSDQEDCGEVGDVTENIPGVGTNICYYASLGVGPDGSIIHPHDPNQKPLSLTPVKEYYDFLLGLKNNHKELIRIGALVGVTNSENPFDTQIIYTSTQSAASIQPACTLENCIGDNCQAWPGTRYIKLAQMFEWNSSIKSICTNSDLLDYLASWVACPSYFLLPEPLLDPDLTAIFINDQPLPFFSCEIPNKIIPCYGAEDTSCPDQSQCTQTWTYQPSDSEYYLSENGSIQFASHIDLCSLSIDEEIDHYCIELICAVE